MSAHIALGSVLAVHPTSSGFGWAVFGLDGELVEWGIASGKEGRKPRLVRRFEKLLVRFEPTALILEAHEGKRSEGIVAFYRTIARAAADAGTHVYIYDRAAIATALDIPLRSSRHAVAQKVAALLPELSHLIPRKQAFGASEDPRQSLFAAAALALTYLIAIGIK